MAKQVKTAKTARKTSRKAVAKTAKTSATRAAPFEPTAKITVVTKDNPRREGKVQHKRYAVIQKFHGKTVEAFKTGKGDILALRYAARQGHVKVA